jgi:hypothetical protein
MKPRRTLFELALSCCLLACSDDDDCKVSLEDCDGSQCVVLLGTPLEAANASEPQPAGCFPRDTNSSEVVTGARDPEGACWSFPTSAIPHGFSEDASCLPQ